jgi:dihydroxy-acid dehydratase
MQTLYRAGGIPAVFKSLEKYLDDSPTVSGKKILQIAKKATVKNKEIIVQVTKEPFSGKGARLTTHISIPIRAKRYTTGRR